MTGTRARSQASLIRALNAWLLKGAPSRPGKINGDPAKSTPPPRSRTPFTLSKKCEPLLERVRQFFCEGQIAKGASFELKACRDNHPAGFVDQPVKRKPCPLVKPAARKKESNGEVVSQVSKVAATALAQFAHELSKLRRCVVTQLGFLGREFGSRALGERICGAQDVIEQREGRFNLEVMGSAPAASRFLVELPCPLRWQSFKRKTFGGRPRDRFKPGAPVGGKSILRKVTLFGRGGDPL